MEFHTSKCQVISITNKVKPTIGKYQIHDHILEQVHCAKYLGIYIDSKLAFNIHVDAIVKKANSTRAFHVRNIHRWDPHTMRNTNKIEMVQRRCACYVTSNFDRTSSVASLLNCLSWPTLEERLRQYRIAVMYRILHNLVDIHEMYSEN